MESAIAGDRRRRDVSAPHRPPRERSSHLPLVMQEIVALMRGSGALLTLHHSNGGDPAILYADARLTDTVRAAIFESLCHGIRTDFEDDRCFWRERIGRNGVMLVMPVEQMPGHGRLVISVHFDKADEAHRREAEQLYLTRRPLAIGFFQQWQQNRVLRQRVQSLESVLDHTAIGVLMIARDRQILFGNDTANEILSVGDGIGRSGGALRATTLGDGVNLHAAISHAIAADTASSGVAPVKVPLLAFHRRNGPPLVAALLPAASPAVEHGDVAAIMYLVDPRIDTGKMLSPLCRLYGLSPVESTLVCHLATGETLASASQQMHLKEQTARGYLKTIFIKTDTKRQTELVVLMLSSLIRMKRDVLQEALTSFGSQRALEMCAELPLLGNYA